MSEEHVILVDQHDQPVGTAEKMAAHQQGLLHRAFSVFIFKKTPNGSLELLLQKRHPKKYHCGGLWTNTCCSHPRVGETILEAGKRRLQEEMGFVVPLESVGHFSYKAEFSNGLTEHEFDHILIGYIGEQKIEPNPVEVIDTAWMPLDSLFEKLDKDPKKYTPWFKPALEIARSSQS